MREKRRKNRIMRIILGSGVSIIALLLITIIAFLNLKMLKERSGLEDNSQIVLLEAERIVNALKDADTGQSGYFLTKNRHCFKSNISSCLKVYGAYNEVINAECLLQSLKGYPQ